MDRALEDTGPLMPLVTAVLVLMQLHTDKESANLVVASQLKDGMQITVVLYLINEKIKMVANFFNILVSFRYHVPRSWLKPTGNLLVVFEEIGGDASKISLVKRSITYV